MGLNDVIINKLNGGLGRREPSTDAYSGMLILGNETGLDIGYGEVMRLNSITDATSVGFSEDNDLSNDCMMYMHIKEFFRINPNGTLWIMLVAISAGIEWKEYLDVSSAFSIKNIIDASEGRINQIAVAFGQETGKTISYKDAIDSAMEKAQSAAEYYYQHHKPLIILLDGFGIIPDWNDASSLINLRSKNCPYVSVLLSNYSDAKIQSGFGVNSTAIGTFLGMVSLAKVNECIAWVQKFNIMGENMGKVFIGQTPFNDFTDGTLNEINEKGYIFFRPHTGISGIYANDSHSSVALTSDYAYIENNRTINKATRIIRQTLLPFLNGPVPVNSTTGQLAVEFVKYLESLGNRAIDEQMFKNNELSGFEFNIDENQNILSTSKLETSLNLIPTGTARMITVNIGFINPFNS